MSDTAIRVQGLGKRYSLGGRSGSYKTLRESVVGLAKGPFRRAGGKSDGRGGRTAFWALKDVDFSVDRGEIVGIVGRNGAGKSTLLKVLSRITDPTEGEIDITGRVGSLLEVGTGFHPELTGRENIFLNGAILGMKRAEIAAKFDEIVAFAETEKFLDTQVKHYSSGMYTRLAFAVAAHLEPEVLIVDEVLAVGDIAFQNKCMGKMGEVASQGRTVLFVSHNMGAVVQLCTRAVMLEGGRLKRQGPTQDVIAEYLSHNAGESGAVDLRQFPARRGSGTVRFEAARLLNGEGSVASEFVMGDDLTVEFDLHVRGPVGSLTIGVELSASNGTKIANMADFDSDFRLTQPSSHERVRVRLPDLRFYPDRYYVGLFVGSGQGRDTYDWCEECLAFDVVGGGKLTSRPLPRTAGLMFFTPTWQRLAAPSP